MSLTPILLLNGSITSNTTYWQDIWLGSHKAVTQYVTDPLRLGGHSNVGSRGLLILTLYEPESQHDTEVQNILMHSNIVCSKQGTSRALFGDCSEAIQCERMTDTGRDFGILETLLGVRNPTATSRTDADASLGFNSEVEAYGFASYHILVGFIKPHFSSI